MSSNCLVTFNSSYEATFSKGYPVVMTPQGRLERLKKTLKSKIQQMEDQDETIHELESHLRRAKEDLTRLKEKCHGRDKTGQSIELAKYEDKLKEFRDILLDATSQLEKVFWNMSKCHDCKKCTCQQTVGQEGGTLHCIRKDLESLQIQKSGSDSCVVFHSGNQTEDRSSPRERSPIKKSLNVTHMENFRKKSVAGIHVLEEMKLQVDTLYGLVKNYFKQMPSDYEKCQLEDCENKFQKLHEEFDCIAKTLSELLDSLNATESDKSDECCNSKKQSTGEASPRSNLCDKIVSLQLEQRELQKEICEERMQLQRVKNELRETEMVLQEKKCQSEEQDKDLGSRQEEISKLRAGVKGFRECLKEMQLEVPEETTPEGSCSSLSILSSELQELCEMLTSLQSSFPGIIEKYREENDQMKSTICCLEKCLENKEQTSSLLHKTLELRDGQIDDLNSRIQSLESDIEKMNQEICKKTCLIGNLQDSMTKAKEFEMKIKDECIATLQFEVCELDARLKALLKEVVKKRKEVELLQDEILYVSSKNFFLNREIDLMEPKLGKMQKNLVLYEKTVCDLEKELSSRKREIEEMCEQVKRLEQELESETKNHERRALDDADQINELHATIRELRNELECANSRSRKSSPVRSARSDKGSSECDENEDSCMICRLRAEICEFKERINQSGNQAEIRAGVRRLEEIVDQGKCRQQMYNNKINELQKALNETVSLHKCETEKLVQKMRKEEAENSKNKTFICKLNEGIKWKLVKENALEDTIKNLQCELENVKYENECLKSTMENMKWEIKDNRDELKRGELDKLINDLEAHKSALKAQCSNFESELENEEKIKKCLENSIDELNDMLLKKTIQFEQLSQNYKCTTVGTQEALAKLRDAEYRLKCMKMAMSRNQCEYSEEDSRGNEDEAMQRECLEKSLLAKTAECDKLSNEVKCLKDQLKSVQNNYVSAQANKNSELARMNREVCRLENEMDLAEKENCRLRNDVKLLHDDLNKMCRREECIRAEIENKEKETNDLQCEKEAMIESVDKLQKRLEQICIDDASKEKENRELREQCARLRKEINQKESQMCEMKHDFEALRLECSQTAEQLKCSGKKIENLKKLYIRASEENAFLEETRCTIENELSQMRNENVLLKQKIQCLKKQKETEVRKFKEENSAVLGEKMRYSCLIKELNCKVKTLEETVIPQLEEEIMRKDKCIESLQTELCEANASSQRMRSESQRVVQCTKKYMGAQKNANEASRSRSPCQKDNYYIGNNDNRDPEEFKSVACTNDNLYFNPSNEKNPYQDAEPRSFSPLPWGCSNVERDNSSPECAVESGFQSLQPSPTNMNYIDYGQDMKRTPSQWNSNLPRQMENQYASCRNPAR